MKLSNLSQSSSMNNNNTNENEKYWKELKKENHDNTFFKVETWVNNLNSEKSHNFKINKIQESKIQIMKNFFALNKFKVVYSVLILAVIFAACTMPVTQNETLGHALSWKVPKNNTDAISKINSMPWVDKSKLSVQEQNDGDKSYLNYSQVFDSKSDAELQSYMKQLQDLNGIASVQLLPLNQTTKVPLYAAALHSFFRVEVDANNKTDAQVTDELQKQLNSAGVDDIKVGYKTKPDGQRMLDVQVNDKGLNRKQDSPDNNKDFELSVKDGNNEQFLKTRHKSTSESLNLEGKSDDEIKRIVAEDMKKNGIDVKPEDLKITRDEKGRPQIEFTHTENSKNEKTERKIELNMK